MRQSTMLGFLEAFGFVTLSFLVLIPFVLLLKRAAGSYLGATGQQPAQLLSNPVINLSCIPGSDLLIEAKSV